MSPLARAPARLRTRDVQLRNAYLTEVVGALHPVAPEDSTESSDDEYLMLPHSRRPRLLVPAHAPQAAIAAIRYYSEPTSRRSRAARAMAVALLRAGGRRMLPGRVAVKSAGSLREHLRDLLDEPVELAIHIGPARANRKPVLPVLTQRGQVVGYAKLGTRPLTRQLMQQEANALATLASLERQRVSVPQLRHHGRWGEHELLLQSALPVWHRRVPINPDRLSAAMREVAYGCGSTTATLADSAYWSTLRSRIDTVARQPDGAALASAATALAARAGSVELYYGAWHGDWSPWNMATLSDTLLLWDWERFATGVPIGFDAIHFDLQQRLGATGHAQHAVATTIACVDRLLGPLAVPAASRSLTALLYLLDLAARYLADRQAEAGARLGVLGTWLLPVLTRQIEELS